MMNLFGVPPQKSHYTLFLDMLGQAGHLTKVARTIDSGAVQPDFVNLQDPVGILQAP
jgi:hypothetical protein